MDKAYAVLSIRAGILCSAADRYLGGTVFTVRGRIYAWELTEELLAQWQEEATSLGVPIEKLLPTADELDDFPRLIDLGMALQAEIDRRRCSVN